MNKEQQVRFNTIISGETDNKDLNSNYLAVSKVFAQKLLEKGTLKQGMSEAGILTAVTNAVDDINEVGIVDRGRLKGILYEVFKTHVTHKIFGIGRPMTLGALLTTFVGEVDYEKDVGSLVSLTALLFFPGE